MWEPIWYSASLKGPLASPSAAGVTDYVVGAAEYLAGTGTADGVMARALDDDTFEVVIIFYHQNVGADLVFGQLEGAVADKCLGAFFPALALVH